MKPRATPPETLRALVGRQASGELICAAESVEVHVYLQRGRIAWATDSDHPFAFTRHLQQTAGLDAEGFRDILESCKREKRPLGETLVDWGLVTQEQIREALQHQLDLALAALHALESGQTVFLDRTAQFAQYNETLTFSLEELPSSAQMATLEPAPPSSRPLTLPPSRNGDGPGAGSARALLDSADGMLWAEVLDGTKCIEAAPEASSRPRFPAEIVTRTLLDGAEFVAIRHPEGTLAGATLSSSQSIWCRLAPHATVGAAASALSTISSGAQSASWDVSPIAPEPVSWKLGDEAAPVLEELRAFLDRAPEILGAVVTEAGAETRPSGMGRAPLIVETALELVTRRARALALPRLFEDGITRDADAEGVGFHFRSMVTAERRVWCFGAELATHPNRMVWILLDRRSSQGIGWAYLTSLSRKLLHLPEWRAP
jgi:hypothetical protein